MGRQQTGLPQWSGASALPVVQGWMVAGLWKASQYFTTGGFSFKVRKYVEGSQRRRGQNGERAV
jgi:hypothetical protein